MKFELASQRYLIKEKPKLILSYRGMRQGIIKLVGWGGGGTERKGLTIDAFREED